MKTVIRDVMSTRVIWVRRNTSFREMVRALSEYRISAFPVLDEEYKVIGVVSEADLLAKEALDSEPRGMPGMIAGILQRKEYEKARGTTAGDLMTSPAVTVNPDDKLERAARLMYTRKVKRLPVVNANGRLVGIVGRSDLLSVFDRSDEDIRREIQDQVIRCDLRTDPVTFTVLVKDGIVTLNGVAETSEFGDDLVQRVRHVQGVVAVRDRLSHPHPPERSDARFDVIARFPVD
jgi:CBS-domain-containing membrane protein